jgi:hypothetical protein
MLKRTYSSSAIIKLIVAFPALSLTEMFQTLLEKSNSVCQFNLILIGAEDVHIFVGREQFSKFKLD